MAKIKSIAEIIKEVSGQDPASEHKLVYDSPSETLEPIYFFILDLMDSYGLKTEKLIDNFSSSPGSQHFGEMGQRSSIMQQQGAKLMGDINTVVRSIINLVYDLREFKIRLQHYNDLDSKNKDTAVAAKLSLKQLYLDKVDIQKGNSSIKAMTFSQQGPFTTLLDAFLAAKDESLKYENGQEIDLNAIVKRALKPRLQDFNIWLKESRKELQKRYDLERSYLKSQVDSLKIYMRWAKPYLKASQDLEQANLDRDPAMVKMFNSLILQLTLMGKREVSLEYSHKYKQKRKYYLVVLVDFRFRGIPNRTQQGFVVGGRAEVTYKSYALNEDELHNLEEEIKKSDLSEALGLITGATEDSLGILEKDVREFLEEKEKDEKNNDKKNTKDLFTKPLDDFLETFGLKVTKKKNEKKEEKRSGIIEKISKDDWVEKNYLRKPALFQAQDTIFNLFEIYKKAHRMPSFPYPPNHLNPHELD